MTRPAPVDLLVALPAHNESAVIVDCLASVGRAVDAAQTAQLVRRARVAIAIHRCTDDTADRARAALARWPRIEPVLLVIEDPVAVGTVRTRLINQAVGGAPPLGAGAWVFSTDADTVVPSDWITATLRRVDTSPTDLVLGLAELSDWPVDEGALAAYEKIIRNGMTADGHRHAYAANLAIRLAAFVQVGGFPALPHGEEHGLAAACRSAGLSVVSTLYPRVQTSARMPGRASDGLGALLAQLAQASPLARDVIDPIPSIR